MMTKNEWLNYFFHADFSADVEALAAIPVGAIDADIATLLAAAASHADTGVFRGDWTDKADAAYSFANAKVIYNGQNSVSLPTKFTFNTVLGIEFTEASVEPPAGTRIYLQYNKTDGKPTVPETTLTQDTVTSKDVGESNTEADQEAASAQIAQQTATQAAPASNAVADEDYSDTAS
jgi:hypothetical protein